MNRTRFITLVALAFVLYIAASAGAASMRFDLGQTLALLIAFGLAFTPAFVARGEPSEAPPRVAVLGVALSLSLSAWVARGLFALAGELFLSMLLPVAGVALLELAITAPDVPPRLMRQVRSARLVRWLAAGAALLGVAAALPPIWLFGRAWIAPSLVAIAPAAFALSALCLALALRLGRRRLDSDARAMAANLWPTFGTCSAASLLALSALLSARGVAVGYVDVAMALGSLTLLLGHAWLVSPTRALSAGPLGRAWLATGLALAAAVAVAWLLRDVWPGDPVLRVAGLAALVLGFEALRLLASRLVFASVAPARGRLLDAVTEVERELASSTSLDELVARVLRPLRRAALLPEAAPLLFISHPQREFRLDAAGQPQIHPRGMPAAVARHFERAGLMPIVRRELLSLLVRRPELREVLDALDAAGAMVALPLVGEGELEGVLFVAEGARRSALTLEELHRLEQLGRGLSALISVFTARERAHARADAAVREAQAEAARAGELAYDLDRVRAQFQALAAGPSVEAEPAYSVAYSPAMRALLERLEQVAPHDLPIALLTEVGMSGVPLARQVHRAGGRSAMPFVSMACGALSPDDVQRVLFGDRSQQPAQPGLLELADQGTLLLCDAAALPLHVQRLLARAVSERRARPLGSDSAYPVQARVVATLRAPLPQLVAAGAFAPELARWLEPTSYRVPPLRERPEDLESLLMIAVDTAARVSGRLVPGLTPEALRALVEYPWPGNSEELESVIARAVLACRGPRITLSDLPPLPVAGAPQLGSFVDQEREILRRALERAGGNKTRAARALGLKRTTLIDKLKRHALDDSGPDTTH